MTCWTAPKSSPWRRLNSAKVCRKTKRAGSLAGNCFAQEHRSEQITGRLTEQSRKRILSQKMGTVLEEADESGYWIELLAAAGKVDLSRSKPLLQETDELVAISISSINTAKRNSGTE